jgi:putative intracellular protease/amidase
MTEGGALLLGVSHTVAETPSPDLVLVPGGTTTPSQMVDDEVLDWLRKVHEATTWTASVCTGALILGHMSKASKETHKLAKEMMDDRMPADQGRLVPKIAWRRFIDLIRTGK